MRIFVTGGSGFIGSNIVRSLILDGHQIGVTYTSGENSNLGNNTTRFNREFIKNNQEMTKYYSDILFHQAANNDTQSKNEKEMMQANFHDPISLFHAFADAGCKKFIYASTTAVYGNSPAPYSEDDPLDPLTPYARSKMKFDEWAMDFAKDRQVNVIGLRYCNVYGQGESHKYHRSSMINQLISQISIGDAPKIFWDGSQKRDWCYIEDVVMANKLAMKFEGTDIVNIGSGRSWNFHQVIDMINKHTERRYQPRYIPNPIRDTYQSHVECKIDKASKLIGYNPVYDIDRGIRDYLKVWS